MRHYPSESRPARIESVSVAAAPRRGPSFLQSLGMAIAAFATGIACCSLAHHCGYFLP